VLRHWDGRTLPDLLAGHGLTDAPEAAFANDGWSGASLTRLVRPSDGAAFVLKRTSWSVDWIARSTRDHALREGFVAATPLPLPEPLVAPYFGAAADGTAVAMLMPDLSDRLLGWELGDGPADAAGIERILAAVARLHAAPWPIAASPDPGRFWPIAPLAERLLLLGPRSAARLTGEGVAAGHRFLEGWSAFDRRASPAAVELVRTLDADPGPLLAALGEQPATALHGDLKLSNVALLADGRIALIDWQMTMLAPVAVELGWLLVGNSGVLPDRPDAVLEAYRRTLVALDGQVIEVGPPFDPRRAYPPEALAAVLGRGDQARYRSTEAVLGDWPAQVDLAWIVGLMLRGWRKGTDAEAGAVIGSGVAATDDLGWWCDRAVEAAGRRL
jgi:hypothetical protein